MSAKAKTPHQATVKNWRAVILLPWLALPLLVGCYAALWSRLPAELAVQFDLSSGAVTNTLGRTTSLLLDSAILLFILGQFTFRLWDSDGGRDMRAVVLAYYGAVIFTTGVFLGILKFNL